MSGVLCEDCEGIFPSSDHLCGLKLLEFAVHTFDCSRMPLPSALKPCNCGLLDLIGRVDKWELEKRQKHPEFGPFPALKILTRAKGKGGRG